MIYDQATETLYGNDGVFIRKVHCPLALRPLDLKPTTTEDRSCSACNKTIRNINEMTDAQVRAAGDDDAQLCVFATSAAKNIVFLQPWGLSKENRNARPVIQTLRSLEAMQAAQKQGFLLEFITVGNPYPFGRHKFIVYQHTNTGALWWTQDSRTHFPKAEEGWKLVRDWFFVRPDRPFPLAAYAIPKDLQEGAIVFVSDVIVDLQCERSSQGEAERLRSSEACWKSGRIQIEEPVNFAFLG